MNRLGLAVRGLRFHRRTALGVLAACAVSSAVLTGALFVGDSVRSSLGRIALSRLGRSGSVVDLGNRYFRDDLPARLGLPAHAALQVKGMALREDSAGKRQGTSNRVDVYGVDPGFLKISESPVEARLAPGEALIGARLAEAIGAKVGDEIGLRVAKPALLSRDAPLASRKEASTRRGLYTVVRILGDAELGRYSLRSNQAAPHVAFVCRKELQDSLDLQGLANLLVADLSTPAGTVREALARAWRIEDAGIAVRALPELGLFQVETRRIYLDPEVSRRAMELHPAAVGAVSYIVDSIDAAPGKSTPYSFVSALTPSAGGVVPAGMKDDEILLNRWLADHLSVAAGGTVTMTYSELVGSNRYESRTRAFRVRGVVEMDALAGERKLVPEFPGLTDVDRCADWDIGLPMKEKELEDKPNEAYWDKYRQTPKAFVTLAAGRSMWANRFGDLMAVRLPAAGLRVEAVQEKLRGLLSPADAGLVVTPVRDAALRAVSESMDLGQLFLGMSSFLIVASLLLTATIFVFSAEQRARELGILLATGYGQSAAARVFLLEGFLVASLGSLAGIPLGAGFAAFLLWGLSGWGSGAVAHATVVFDATLRSAISGALGAAFLSISAMALAIRRLVRRPVRELVSEDFSAVLERDASKPRGGRGRVVVFVGGLLGAVAVAGGAAVSGSSQLAPAFFGAGSLLLVAGLALSRMFFSRAGGSAARTVAGLGVRNASRRPGRGLAAAAMLACGIFMVIAVSAMKEDLSGTEGRRESGSGGFALYAETSVPVVHDLESARGRGAFRLDGQAALEGVSILPLKALEGDDASCLNLNQALTPSLLGVDPDRLSALGAFAPAETWDLLKAPQSDGAVPALVGDVATAMWKLKKRVHPTDGDVLEYRDERGVPARIRLVGSFPQRLSVLQGRLLLAERDFARLFPGSAGAQVFLLDAPKGKVDAAAALLSERLESVGWQGVRPVDRLRQFYEVESAYLTMFVVLGGLGLLLGTAGLSVLVLRNLMERRSELALLQAVGFTPSEIRTLVAGEHRLAVRAGLGVGLAAALLALLPALLRPGASLPGPYLALVAGGTIVLTEVWIALATNAALRAPLVPALRNE